MFSATSTSASTSAGHPSSGEGTEDCSTETESMEVWNKVFREYSVKPIMTALDAVFVCNGVEKSYSADHEKEWVSGFNNREGFGASIGEDGTVPLYNTVLECSYLNSESLREIGFEDVVMKASSELRRLGKERGKDIESRGPMCTLYEGMNNGMGSGFILREPTIIN